MLLADLKESGGWILSRWNLTYRTGWEHICKAVYYMYEFYMQPEVLIYKKKVNIHAREDILKLDEGPEMTIRGMSTILKVPITITFMNQTGIVEVGVAQATDEFAQADYRAFNLSLGQYMDSIELAMYR